MSQKPKRTVRRPKPWDPESGDRPELGAVDEILVDAPTRQTLGMLGVICVSTLLMWAAGRAACNYHVPGEGLTPREVSLADKSRTPKGTAVEFAQALSGADFDTAGKLVSASGANLVGDAKQACGACVEQRAARDGLMTVPEVLSQSRSEAYVAVTTFGAPGGKVERVLHLDRESERELPWRVTAVLPNRQNLPQLEGALEQSAEPSLRLRRGGPPGLPPGHPTPGSDPETANETAPTTPEPTSPAPKPVVPTPAPSGPARPVPTPKPVVPTPAPSGPARPVPTPKPVVPTPAPSGPTPDGPTPSIPTPVGE